MTDFSPQYHGPDLAQMETGDLRLALLDLICQGAYQEGDFVLTSGQRSTYYINGKLATLHPQGALMLGRLMLEHISSEVLGVAGLTLGADPMVSAVSLVAMYGGRQLFPLIIRKEAKGHGTKAYIEGVSLPAGSTITVLEDVVTTGQSALKAVERLQGAGYKVDQILALVDRQQGGAELYAEQGIAFTALFALPEVQAHWVSRNA